MRTPTLHVARDGTETYKIRFRDGDGHQTSETFVDQTAAQEFAVLLDVLGPAAALAALYAGEQKTDVPNLDALAADHILHLTGIEEGTRLGYTRLWERTWSPLIGHLPADLADLRDKIRLATNELAKRYAYKSLKNQRGLLHGVCDRGIEKGYITSNPTRRLRLPEGTANPDVDDEHDMRLIEQAEFGILVDAFTDRYRPFIRFFGGTGARWGEVVVLRKRDFALKPKPGSKAGPVVRIHRALKWSPDGKRSVGVTKTRKSRRTVTVPRELVPELLELLDGLKPDDLVFTNAGGRMIQHRTFWSDHWRPAIWRAQHCPEHTDPACRCGTAHPKRCTVHAAIAEPCGCAGMLSVGPRIHDMRHSHASWLLAAGVPIHVAQARLGHESIQTTVDTYGHLLPDAQLAAAEAAAAAFAELSPTAREAEIQRELAGLDLLMQFLDGDDELPAAVVAALEARGWTHTPAAIEA